MAHKFGGFFTEVIAATGQPRRWTESNEIQDGYKGIPAQVSDVGHTRQRY
jgi:hypothetical protein